MSAYQSHVIELEKANLVLLKAKKGYVMCGLLNLETAERLGQAACTVSGVSNEKDALAAKIKGCTSAARGLGIVEGMSAQDALKRMS